MNKSKQSIRTQLEKQAKKEFTKSTLNKSKLSVNRNSLQLNWKDAVVFSLVMVFGCGYWIQSNIHVMIGG